MKNVILIVFAITCVHLNNNLVTCDAIENLFEQISKTFSPLATQLTAASGTDGGDNDGEPPAKSSKRIRQYAVFYLSDAPTLTLDPPPTAFPADKIIDGNNYLAAIIGGPTGVHTEAMLLPKLESKIDNFKKEKSKNPNWYLFSYNTPCCKANHSVKNQCGGGSCSELINNYINTHRAKLDKIYIAWDKFLGIGMQPLSRQYLYILNTLLQQNTATEEKVKLVVRPEGFADKQAPRSSFLQNEVINCLKKEAKEEYFTDKSKFDENIIKIVNTLTWHCGTTELKKGSSKLYEANCWTCKVTECPKMADAVAKCAPKKSKKIGLGPAIDPITGKRSNSAYDVRGTSDVSPYEKEKCKRD
ncbi:uncharacterized protein LOC130635456 [Hydractinia symbiolongicarpus]|uniref:uncharacterized protein LOC130635456 n=1 Tax=Hydractinia symbiolongicarpus TaxID=13093 RepID=UPI00254F58DA|nr:uncharacterized protein LOC130635456 [Hydractinia symbiolongicarpus]